MSNAPKTLTVTECHQLLDALLVKDGTANQFRKGVRNYLMALLMLDAGLRVGEVVKLKILDLFFGGQPVSTLVINTRLAEKECEREIPVSRRLYGAIYEMCQKWWSYGIRTKLGFGFFTANRDRHITTRQVERIIRTAAMKCLGRPVHPHALRHTFATRLMRKTNARVVQELLGHKNISSTQIYTHPNGDDLKNAITMISEPPPKHDHKGLVL